MKIAGIVVEYNPFHNGHFYHVQKTKELTSADCVVAVMSGNFLQRGEFAFVSKWMRTKMALQAGVDLVIELPYAYSTQHAETFAFGSISLLDHLGVDSICFGSEHGSTDAFYHLLEQMQKKEADYRNAFQTSIQAGNSYAKSLSSASKAISNLSDDFLSSPNNILGMAYISAISKLSSKINVHTIMRTKAQYHDEFFTDKAIASATAIRRKLEEGNSTLNDIEPFVPESIFNELLTYQIHGGQFHKWEDYYPLLRFEIMRSTAEDLRNIYEVEEGLEYRLKKYITEAASFKEFMSLLKTKRYTWTRLQRMLIHIVTNAKKDMMKQAKTERPGYIRPLGFTEKGQMLLKEKREELAVPIIYNLQKTNSALTNHQIQADIIYTLPYKEESNHPMLQNERTNRPVIITSKTSHF